MPVHALLTEDAAGGGACARRHRGKGAAAVVQRGERAVGARSGLGGALAVSGGWAEPAADCAAVEPRQELGEPQADAGRGPLGRADGAGAAGALEGFEGPTRQLRSEVAGVPTDRSLLQPTAKPARSDWTTSCSPRTSTFAPQPLLPSSKPRRPSPAPSYATWRQGDGFVTGSHRPWSWILGRVRCEPTSGSHDESVRPCLARNTRRAPLLSVPTTRTIPLL